MQKALVAGALGVVGRNLIEHLQTQEGWQIVGLSRREPEQSAGFEHVSVDLLDPKGCQEKLRTLTDISHVFYAARAPGEDFATEAAVNLRMLTNLVDALEPVATKLRHIHLVHGTKWYGCQIGPFKTPSREDDPRQLRPCFYYDQQDFIEARQQGKPWSWSSVRPPLVCGFSAGYPHNLLTTIGVYAAICAELEMPFRFPGSQACYDTIYQAVDANLLAESMVWAATTEGCKNEAFNVTNGDVYRWRDLWPQLAAFFHLEPAGVQEVSLAKTMPAFAPTWEKIAARHRLKPYAYEALGNWTFADLIFSLGWDDISSTVKSRHSGFAPALDTTEMFLRLFGRLRHERILP